MNAHNLAMVALTSRMQHERNYDDETLLRLSGRKRLNIDPTNVSMGWVLDYCCQALRHIVIGMGGRSDGFLMQSHFDIAVSSEVMAILAIARDLRDLRERMGRIIVAYDRAGVPVTTADLQVDGAMTAWMVEAAKPNLIQTIEGQPVFVHAGPFANIALGQSSVTADLVGLKLSDYHVTESGFGADIGYEKFWNLKCHYSGLAPDAAVVVATVRALKSHGGAPAPRPGRPLPDEYRKENAPYPHGEKIGRAPRGVHQRLCGRHQGGAGQNTRIVRGRGRARGRVPSLGTGGRGRAGVGRRGHGRLPRDPFVHAFV